MIAATKSRLECSASESTPRLPVRMVRNTFSDTSATADTTDHSAALFFSRAPSIRGDSALIVPSLARAAPHRRREHHFTSAFSRQLPDLAATSEGSCITGNETFSLYHPFAISISFAEASYEVLFRALCRNPLACRTMRRTGVEEYVSP